MARRTNSDQKTIDSILGEIEDITTQFDEAINEGLKTTATAIRDDAASMMSAGYGAHVQSEVQKVHVINKDAMSMAEDPSEAIKDQVIVIEGGRDKRLTRGLGGKYEVGIGNISELDAMADRAGKITVRVPSKRVVNTKSGGFLPGVHSRKGSLYKVQEFTIEGRDPERVRSGNKSTNNPGSTGWRLWRAIEYGQPPTKDVARVTIRTVRAIRGQFLQFNQKDSRWGPYVTFMTPRPQYWERHIDEGVTGWVDREMSYWGGSRPMGTALDMHKRELWSNIMKELESRGVGNEPH